MSQQDFYSSIAKSFNDIFPLQEQQVEFVKSALPATTKFSFVDVGCSTGQLANRLCLDGATGIGIDLNEDMIEIAKADAATSLVDYQVVDMLRLADAFPSANFDLVICFGNTIVHLDSVEQVSDFLNQCCRLLKTSGYLLLQLLDYQFILDNQVRELPLIENENIRFNRSYRLPTTEDPKIDFNTSLTVKNEGVTLENTARLLPLRKEELDELLKSSGFTNIQFFSGFNKRPYLGNSLPLVVIAQK